MLIFILLIGDWLICIGAYFLSFTLRTHFDFFIFSGIIPVQAIEKNLFSFLILAGSQTISFYFFGLYENPKTRINNYTVSTILLAGIATVMLTTFIYFFSSYFYHQRSVLVVFMVLQLSFVYLFRKLTFLFVLGQVRQRNIILIGSVQQSLELMKQITINPFLKTRYKIKAIASLVEQNTPIEKEITDNDTDSHNTSEYHLIKDFQACLKYIEEHPIDEIFMVSEASWKDIFFHQIYKSIPKNPFPAIHILPSPFEIKIGKVNFYKLYDIPTFRPNTQLVYLRFRFLKRILDILLSFILLVLFSPIMMLTSLIIKITTKGPIFYKQKRVGRNMHEFTCLKFRTMIHNAEADTGAVLSPKHDPRVTNIGKYLRKTRIDELPQLYNVLKGDMSVVGPRPERMKFVKKFQQSVLSYNERLMVKPGITGLAQIQGLYHTSAEVKLKYDLAYIYNWNVWFDLRILIETIKVVLTSKGH